MSIINAGSGSLSALRNPYTNAIRGLEQFGRDHKAQRELDYQHGRQALADKLSAAQENRRIAEEGRQVTQAEHQNIIFSNQQDKLKTDKLNTGFNKAYLLAADNYFNAKPTDKNYGELTNIFNNAKQKATSDFIIADNKRRALVKTQNSTNELNGLKLSTLKTAKKEQESMDKINATINPAKVEMDARTAQLTKRYIGDGSQFTSQLTGAAKDLYKKGTDNYNLLSPKEQAQYDNLMTDLGNKVANMGGYNTYQERLKELDTNNSANLYKYINEDGKFNNDKYYMKVMAKTTISENAKKQAEIASNTAKMDSLYLSLNKLPKGTSNPINTYKKAITKYQNDTTGILSKVRNDIAKNTKDTDIRSSKYAKANEYAGKGYTYAQITQLLSGKTKVGYPARIQVTKNTGVDSANSKLIARIGALKDRNALLMERDAQRVGKMKLNNTVQTLFNDIKLHGDAKKAITHTKPYYAKDDPTFNMSNYYPLTVKNPIEDKNNLNKLNAEDKYIDPKVLRKKIKAENGDINIGKVIAKSSSFILRNGVNAAKTTIKGTKHLVKNTAIPVAREIVKLKNNTTEERLKVNELNKKVQKLSTNGLDKFHKILKRIQSEHNYNTVYENRRKALQEATK